MFSTRVVLPRSRTFAIAARKVLVPSTKPFWRKGCSLSINIPRQYSSTAKAESVTEYEGASRPDYKGIIRDVDHLKATITLPQTAMNQLHERNIDVHFVQLRDACQCPRCVDPQTKQRFFRTGDIPKDITPRQMRWLNTEVENDAEKILEIYWNKDIAGYDHGETHVTRLTADEIKYPSAYFHQKTLSAEKPRAYWNRKDMEAAQPWIDYEEYMQDDGKFKDVLNRLSMYGLIFVKNIPDSREMVSKIATRMGPLRNTFYGWTWDVRSDPKAKNVAYTNQNLGFHMDLLYVQNPPGFQLLHCLKNSCEGGESLFVDAFGAAMDLDQKSWQTLSNFKVPYHYDHEEQYYRSSRPLLELSEEHSLSDSEGDRGRMINHVNYSPPFQGPFHISQAEYSDWSQKAEDYLSALKQFECRIEDPSRIFELKLEPGQCVIFENRRVLHARRAFDTTSGERWLAGAYVDEDAVHSKMFTLNRDSGTFRGDGWR